jgi:streptomycin 6-kinase
VTSWEEPGRPCPEKTAGQALACAVRRAQAQRDEGAVLVHGDVHQLNALQDDGGFGLIDPDGLLAEANSDLGVLMRGDPAGLPGGDPAGRARALAARTGLDLVAIWEWGVAGRLSTGLLCYPHPPTAPRPRHASGGRGRRRPV